MNQTQAQAWSPDSVTREILERAQLPWAVITESRPSGEFADDYPCSLGQGKQHLYLCRNRGQFFKPCPGTKEYLCCKYEVLGTGMNCPMDCVYCILQAYLNSPWITHYVNTEDLLAELDQVLDADPLVRAAAAHALAGADHGHPTVTAQA